MGLLLHFHANCCTTKTMIVSNKKQGRPKEKEAYDPVIGIRVPWPDLHALDRWARAAGLSRSEVIRKGIQRILEEKPATEGS